ncbi:hypothetical protein AB25_2582 [Escherichia coli 2-005-03_S1_C2]|nr:hypothetical protein ECDEC2E_2260 [Escherichia coli DEC2E]EZK11612.1 hypothetical protein AB53_4157 [Escherichia coli 2-005-03_S1_C3]EZK33022.1 hypothetical protein AB25_2582 [Escherichia coli 2-005-03_S1_C2]
MWITIAPFVTVITPAFEKLRWKSNLGKPPCPELIPEMLS